MPSPFSQLFRKTGGDSPAEAAGDEDLERGERLSAPNSPTASGYPWSPSRVYLPEMQNDLASTVIRTTSSCEYLSQIRSNGQHGPAVQLPLMPSGPSRVIGYLPRTTCNGSSSLVIPTKLIMTSQHSQNASRGDLMGHKGPRSRSSSVSSTAFDGSLSLRPPFDPCKHGPALRRLETHGSLKTVPSSQHGVDALSRPALLSVGIGRELSEEDHAAALRDLHLRPAESQDSAELCELSDQQSGVDLPRPPTQYLPNTAYQPVVPNRGHFSKVVNLLNASNLESRQVFGEALPSSVYSSLNSEVNNSSQVNQEALHRSQVPPKPHQALSSKSARRETIALHAWPDLRSRDPSSEGTLEEDTIGRVAGDIGAGAQGSGLCADKPAHLLEEERKQQSLIGNPVSDARQAHPIIQSPDFEGIDEYLWSPAPSVDGEEAPLAHHTPIPHRRPSDALRASPHSGLASDSHGGLSRSIFQGEEHIHYQSSRPGNLGVMDSILPHIDVLIPAGKFNLDSHSDFLSSSQQASTMGSREPSSMLFRYSGIITDGASSRPMSKIELEEGVLHSSEDRAKTALSMPNSMNSSIQMDRSTGFQQAHGEQEPNARSEVSPFDQLQNPPVDFGPGGSQTSSSLSTDRYGGNLSSHKARLGIHELPISRTRCYTPPLLFGQSATSGPGRSNPKLSPAIGSAASVFDQNVRATRLKETGRLPTALYNSDEQDWETVSAETEAHTHAFDSIAFDAKIHSSLADNSDSGSLSLSKEMPYPFHSIKSHPVLQHPVHPRLNYSFMLLKNSQTGDLVQVPEYKDASGICLPYHNTSSQLVSSIRANSTYQHPSPLQVEHIHPLTSSPPTIRSIKPLVFGHERIHGAVQQNYLQSGLSRSGLSEEVQGVKEKQSRNPLYKPTSDVIHIPRPALNYDQCVMDSKEQSPCQSSAWFSTVSKVTSTGPSLHEDGGNLVKIMARDGKGHMVSTPELIPNRKVGSSLADASSLGANFSSSPVPLANSLTQSLDTLPCLGQRLHKQGIQHDSESGSQLPLASFHKSLARSSSCEDSGTPSSKIEDHSRSYSACGLRLQHRKPSPRRSKSSSESSSRLMDLPSVRKTSVMKLLSSDGDAQQINRSRFLLRNPFSHMDEKCSQYNYNQRNLVERRGRQPNANDASIELSTTPSSTGSRPFVRDRVVHTDIPSPILDHSVYGRERPWNRITTGPLRSRPLPKPLGPASLLRPVARVQSPHLHRIPHPPTAELLERHILLSRIYLVPSMMIPPIALLYGHGYMDGLLRLHAVGGLNGFRSTEKTIALCWGYGLSAICIFAVTIAMVLILASA